MSIEYVIVYTSIDCFGISDVTTCKSEYEATLQVSEWKVTKVTTLHTVLYKHTC